MTEEQGLPEGPPPEVLAALQDAIEGADDDALRDIAGQIADAGGWQQWYEGRDQSGRDTIYVDAEGNRYDRNDVRYDSNTGEFVT